MAKTKYDHKIVEKHWQERWEREKVNYPKDILKVKNKYYNLWMFPYPSGEGLHAGHAFASTGSDIYGRFMRMNGNDVFQPIGYDSFGMHSENYALKINEHPKKMLDRTTKNYEKQMKSLGHGFDWTRTVATSDPDYYKWTQWIFVQLFKAGLAYRKKSNVNWCPSCKTVLADEQVMTPAQAGKEPKMIDGSKVKDKENAQVCERCGYVVEEKALEQWFLRITDYADRLLDNLEKIDWTEKVKIAQRNWIGRSYGANVKFQISNTKRYIEVFTTAHDTIFGVTFMVLAPEYVKDLLQFVPKDNLKKVTEYINISLSKSVEERRVDEKEKTGVDTGISVVNPVSNEKIPVYVADYVLMDYGTGAVMGVPGHDARDYDFAKKYKLPIKVVVKPDKEPKTEANVEKDGFWDYVEIKNKFSDESVVFDSGFMNGLSSKKAKQKFEKWVEENGVGKKGVEYHLRDWLISRQRYWGPPIPMIHCEKCAKGGKSWFTSRNGKRETENGKRIREDQSDWEHAGWYPEENLPVELPYLKDFKPKGGGRGPLADHPEFYETKCPECGGKARRETDVSDTFVDSSWYFLRYPSVGAGERESERARVKSKSQKSLGNLPWDPEITRKWLPVDLYFGGAEHSVLHLMYARFVTQVLHDLKYLEFEEPFPKFFAHGLMIKDGAKMSKSRGNVVNPDEYIDKFGADALRLYLMFMGPMDGYPDFRDTGIEGMRRFVEKVWQLFQADDLEPRIKDEKALITKRHQTIKKVTEDIKKFHYNTAIAEIMEYVNALRALMTKGQRPTTDDLKVLTLLIAPLAPHIAEEIWVNVLGQKFSVHKAPWPKYAAKYIKEDQVVIAIQVNGKLRATLRIKNLESRIKNQVIQMAKEDERIKKWIKGKKIKKEIFVPGKLVNFVIKGYTFGHCQRR